MPTLAPNRLTKALASAARRAGGPIIDLTVSNPTTRRFPLSPGSARGLADPRGLVYRPEPLGLAEAREAVAADYAPARDQPFPPSGSC